MISRSKMNKTQTFTSKSRFVFYAFLVLVFALLGEGLYLESAKSTSDAMLEKKIAFVKLSTLPDLAIATEASYVRHRSLSEMFSLYKEDGSLREYFPSTFAISHSHIINPQASK